MSNDWVKAILKKKDKTYLLSANSRIHPNVHAQFQLILNLTLGPNALARTEIEMFL
jgi:hypothetical protein